MYQKEIIYMGLYKSGTRIGSAGFVKVESRENDSRLYLKTQNIPHSISGRFPIRVYNGSDWKELSGITIRDGGGIWEEELAGRTDRAMLQVMLPGGYMLEGKSKLAVEPRQGMPVQRENMEAENREAYREAAWQDTGEQEEGLGQRNVEAEAREETTIRQDMGEQEEGSGQKSAEAEVRKETMAWQDTGEQEEGSGQKSVEAEVRKETMARQDIGEQGESFEQRNVEAEAHEETTAWQDTGVQEESPERRNTQASARKESMTQPEELRGEAVGTQGTEPTMPRDENPSQTTPPSWNRPAIYNDMPAPRETVAQTAAPQVVLVKEELPRRTMQELTPMKNNAVYPVKEDKWEQILDTYEQIHPYGDERVYVKLEPKDFVLLQSKYQHLVNNSFLLHGFYNYRYVILGKEGDYYLGVPGVFYEREKMVALMFGFEAFECPGGNVRAGTFGYYLRKVEL